MMNIQVILVILPFDPNPNYATDDIGASVGSDIYIALLP